jgi:hypothetical protein
MASVQSRLFSLMNWDESRSFRRQMSVIKVHDIALSELSRLARLVTGCGQDSEVTWLSKS